MTTELKINNAINQSSIYFFANHEIKILEISMDDFDGKKTVIIDIEKNEAKQIISFLQNHFNL
jgi:hypothetical protein